MANLTEFAASPEFSDAVTNVAATKNWFGDINLGKDPTFVLLHTSDHTHHMCQCIGC